MGTDLGLHHELYANEWQLVPARSGIAVAGLPDDSKAGADAVWKADL
jgi:hypothetical protein